VASLFAADAPGVPVTADMGARIESADGVRNILSYWRRATFDPEAHLWSVTLDSPPWAGDFNFVWRTGDPEPPDFELVLPLSVALPTVSAA
jgi:hypothetical protein